MNIYELYVAHWYYMYDKYCRCLYLQYWIMLIMHTIPYRWVHELFKQCSSEGPKAKRRTRGQRYLQTRPGKGNFHSNAASWKKYETQLLWLTLEKPFVIVCRFKFNLTPVGNPSGSESKSSFVRVATCQLAWTMGQPIVTISIRQTFQTLIL